jgi:nicotinate-nucleotide--dimethylbenzimidazole phosphoribosyltransferase
MTRAQALAALATGAELADALARDGVGLIGIGEMGIANTTASSALAAVFTGAPPEEVTGRGTGIDEATFRRKIAVVRRGIQVNRPDAADAADVAAKVGGFERSAGLAGVASRSGLRRRLARSRPPSSIWLLPRRRRAAGCRAHRAARRRLPDRVAQDRSRPATACVLRALYGTKPLLDLDLRLGEVGPARRSPLSLVDAALAIAAEMATFRNRRRQRRPSAGARRTDASSPRAATPRRRILFLIALNIAAPALRG